MKDFRKTGVTGKRKKATFDVHNASFNASFLRPNVKFDVTLKKNVKRNLSIM